MSDIFSKKGNVVRLICLYLLPIGVLGFFLGLFFLSGRNEFKAVFYWAVLAPTLIVLLLERRFFLAVKFSSTLQLVLVFLLFASISIFWSDSDRSFFHYIKRELYIFSFIMSFVCIYTYSPKRFMQTLIVSCVGAAVFAGYFLFDYYVQKGMSIHYRITGSGVLYNPLLSAHVFGFYMVLILNLLLQMNWGWKKKSLLFCLLLPISSFVLMTHSRTPLLGLGVMLVTFLIVSQNKKAILIFFGFTVAYVFMYFYYPTQFVRGGVSERPYIWQYTLGVVSQQPIWGIGLDNSFGIPIQPEFGQGVYAEPHNIHLSVLLRTGLIGFSLWGMMYLTIFKDMILSSQLLIGRVFFFVVVFGAACALTEGGAFFSRPKEQWFIIWLPIALTIAVQAGSSLRKQSFFLIENN